MVQLDDEGYITHLGEGIWNIINSVMVIVQGLKNGTLYMMSSKYSKYTFTSSDSRPGIIVLGIWEKKTWRFYTGKLSMLGKTDMKFYANNVFSKQRHLSFTINLWRPKQEKLELVHNGVRGPTLVDSNGNTMYFSMFIDDSTRKVWVYFLKKKSNVFSIFRTWKLIVENQTGLHVKCLHSNNDGEYNSCIFKSYYVGNSIVMEKTIMQIPQQNGEGEKMNRALWERVRSMRPHVGLLKGI